MYIKTRDDDEKFNEFLNKISAILTVLGPYGNSVDLNDIRAIKHNFKLKIGDFYREGRKLNIGVIGRVKAGKSSFLDTFLFSGKDILPKAVTPKTATLTRIEYSKDNRIEVEYYTDYEWSIMKEKARALANHSENIVAREILSMVDERNLNPYEYTQKGIQSINFNSYDTLMSELNQYVGENGLYTPLVKAVTLYVNIPELKDVSIVDTPGISDPIASRTDKTKKFIELCDVVFFMSKANSFMDKNDMDLLMEKIPQKGIKRFVFICSRFDDGIRDIIHDVSSIDEASELVKDKLCNYSNVVLDDYRNSKKYAKLDVLKQMKEPIFISSTAYNMMKKEYDDFTEYEKKLYNDLNAHNDLTKEKLKQISNMPAIRKIFDEVLEEKEEVLDIKAKKFTDDANEELNSKLELLEKEIYDSIDLLNSNEKQLIIDRQNSVNDKIKCVSANINKVFDEIFASLDVQKSGALRDLRAGNRTYSVIHEKDDVKVKYKTKRVSNSRWFEPWKWGETKSKLLMIDTKFSYIDPKDAIANIEKYVADASSSMQCVFSNAIDTHSIKCRIYDELMDDYEENIPHLKMVIEKLVTNIKFPVVNINASRYVDHFKKKYKNENIEDEKIKKNINEDLIEIIGKLFDDFNSVFLAELDKFKNGINSLKEMFIKEILKDSFREMKKLSEKYANIENQIDIYREIIDKIEKVK